MKTYSSNAERQAAYRLRKRQAEIKDQEEKRENLASAPLTDIVEYFKLMNRIEKTIPEQEQLLRAMIDPKIPNLLAVCGRGFSKTQCASTVTMWYADEFARFIKRPIRILLISMNNEIFSYIDNMFLNYPSYSKRLRVEGRSLKVPMKEFQLSDTLSRVMRVVPTVNSTLSKRCDILIIDETASVPTKVIKSALACLSGEEINKVIFISTPHQVGSLFNDYVKNVPQGWSLQQYSSLVCPWAQKTIERLRPILSEAEFEVQINAKIPKEEIIPLLKPEDIESCIEESTGLTLLPENKMLAGLDLAKGGRSLTVLTIAERTKGYDKVILVKFWSGETPFNQILEEASTILKGHNLGSVPIRVQVDSKPIMGIDLKLKDLCQFLIRKIDASQRARQANTEVSQYSPTYKELMRSYLYTLVTNHKLKVARSEEELLYQLRNYRTGMIYGDDYVDSLMLALTNFPEQSARFGRISILNYNTGEIWDNFGNQSNQTLKTRGTNFKVFPNNNREKKSIFSRS